MERSVVRIPWEGTILANVFGTDPDNPDHWLNSSETIEERRWMSEVRMPRATFQQLLGLVEQHMPPSRPYADGMRAYTHEEKLFMTLSWLAAIPTLRYMAEKFACPPSTLNMSVLRPTIRALLTTLFHGEHKQIRWPSSEQEQQDAAAAFSTQHGLPGCIGAIDGSLIPMRKPSKVESPVRCLFSEASRQKLVVSKCSYEKALCDGVIRYSINRSIRLACLAIGAKGTLPTGI